MLVPINVCVSSMVSPFGLGCLSWEMLNYSLNPVACFSAQLLLSSCLALNLVCPMCVEICPFLVEAVGFQGISGEPLISLLSVVMSPFSSLTLITWVLVSRLLWLRICPTVFSRNHFSVSLSLSVLVNSSWFS